MLTITTDTIPAAIIGAVGKDPDSSPFVGVGVVVGVSVGSLISGGLQHRL